MQSGVYMLYSMLFPGPVKSATFLLYYNTQISPPLLLDYNIGDTLRPFRSTIHQRY